MRAKLLDALKGLKERQEAQVAESERLFHAAKQGGGWVRPLQKSLGDLAAAEATLGGEVGPLVEKHFHDAKVISHLVRQAAEALAAVEPAVEKVRNGPMDLDSWDDDRLTVQEPQRLALKRLTQLMDVFKDDAGGAAVMASRRWHSSSCCVRCKRRSTSERRHSTRSTRIARS
jgi:hypothetical protein